jgi:hypothetical protein
MQLYQIIPIVIVVLVAVYAVAFRNKGGAGQMYAQGLAAIGAEARQQQRAGESEPACIMAMTRTTFKGKMFYLALTNQRLFIAEHGGSARGFERNSLALQIERKRWADIGNMQTTYSEGWEARATLPGGESHVWRIYAATDPQSPDAQHLATFLHNVGA